MTADRFTLASLPYGVATIDGVAHVMVRVGEQALDLAALSASGRLTSHVDFIGNLDALIAAGPAIWQAVRMDVAALAADLHSLSDAELVDVAGLALQLPFTVGDYVDFYSSVHHATNLGKLFRPNEEPLMDNWKRLPIGYHGRSSTIIASDQDIVRPKGMRPNPGGEPTYGPCRRLDIELEVGFVVGGPGNTLGDCLAVDAADEHIFGVVMVNDWSARDIQAYEYKPLGPFLGKSFATSISYWVTPLSALTPALRPAPTLDPPPAAYLSGERDWALALELEVYLETAAMRSAGTAPERISANSFEDMYWTFAQQLAHTTANGAIARAGDFYASGTVSGPTAGTEGSFIELTWNGERPIALPTGEERKFLEDGDRIILRGAGIASDGTRIDLGDVAGTIAPAR